LKGFFFITIFINLLIYLIRSQGGLERLELLVFDYFVQSRLPEERPKRIVLVTVSESDIQKLEKWPLSDAKLARLLQNINRQKPRSIGLDIYRDLSIPPGNDTLKQVYRSIPNLIAIQKVAGTNVSPPQVLAELGQTAANDLVIDQDGRVRRLLLSLVNKNDEVILSLSLRLSLMYLAEEGIVPEQEGEDIILGKAKISPITPSAGSYIRQDTGGFQILANYGRFYPDYPRIPITDVLEGKIPPNIMTDRIVLIGATAASLGDRFQTPLDYEGDDLPGTPGVEIHAASVNQLLSSAIEGRPLLYFWHDRVEDLWLIFWGISGGTLALTYDKWIKTIGLASLCLIILLVISFIMFLLGYWIPLVPPLLSFLITFTCNLGYVLWNDLLLSQQELKKYAITLEEKVKDRTKELELSNHQLLLSQTELQTSFDRLALANKEIADLNQTLASENLRLKYELDVAGKIQEMILPKEDVFTNDYWEIVGFMQPATEVGGDYYDFITMEDGIRIGVGDVTDHGLESGVIMLMVQTAIKTMTEFSPYPSVNVLTMVNQVLHSNLTRIKSDRSLTLAIVDLKEDVIQITGQHEDVIILRKGGTIEIISTESLGFPLGLIDDVAEFFNLHEVQINEGDVIILFTDGVTEAANQQKELYGIDRLCRVANEAKNKSAKEICHIIVQDVMNFIDGNVIYDDITLIVVKRQEIESILLCRNSEVEELHDQDLG